MVGDTRQAALTWIKPTAGPFRVTAPTRVTTYP